MYNFILMNKEVQKYYSDILNDELIRNNEKDLIFSEDFEKVLFLQGFLS